MYTHFYRQHRNKLDLPTAEDAFCGEGEREIIEEYDEKTEEAWREQHRVRVREHKQRERTERERIAQLDAKSEPLDSDDEDEDDERVNRLLDTLEGAEDLDYELSLIPDNKESDEIVQKLLRESAHSESDRKRVAHATKTKTVEAGANVKIPMPSTQSAKHSIHAESTSSSSSDDDAGSDASATTDSDEENLPEQMIEYREAAKPMAPTQRLQFYRKKLREWERKYRNAKGAMCPEDVEHETDCMFMCDHLENEIFRLEDDPRADSSDETDEAQANATGTTATDNANLGERSQKPRRSVSFGADEVASFSKHQAPCRVSDDLRNNAEPAEENCNDVVDDNASGDVLASKVDELKLSKSASNESLGAAGKSILKNREAVHQEPRKSASVGQPKIVADEKTKNVTEKPPAATEAPRAEFDKILGEIFENVFPKAQNPMAGVQTAIPDPLPGETFRDAHAPKQRVSRFKASRQK